MKARILDSAMIIDFMGDGFESVEICSTIKTETEKSISLIKSEKLEDWEICFRFWYNNVRQILIYTKNKSYPKERVLNQALHEGQFEDMSFRDN